MDSVSGSGYSPQQQAPNRVINAQRVEVQFGPGNSVFFVSVLNVLPTQGLNTPRSFMQELPQKVQNSLLARKTSKAPVEKTVTIKKRGFNGKELISQSTKNLFSSITRPIKHENWKPIPQEMMDACPKDLKDKMQSHNEMIKRLEGHKSEWSESQKELKELKEQYKNTLKLYSDPQSIVRSKKNISIPIPGDDGKHFVISSQTPAVREGDVDTLKEKVKGSGLIGQIDQLEKKIKKSESDHKELRESLRRSGDKIIVYYQEVNDSRLSEVNEKARKGVEELSKSQENNLSELKKNSSKQQKEYEENAEVFKNKVDKLNNESQLINKELQKQQTDLRKLKKSADHLKLQMSGEPSGKFFTEAHEALSSGQKTLEVQIEANSSRLADISAELADNKLQLENTKKLIRGLAEGKELKKQKNSDTQELKENEKQLAKETKGVSKENDTNLKKLKRLLRKK